MLGISWGGSWIVRMCGWEATDRSFGGWDWKDGERKVTSGLFYPILMAMISNPSRSSGASSCSQVIGNGSNQISWCSRGSSGPIEVVFAHRAHLGDWHESCFRLVEWATFRMTIQGFDQGSSKVLSPIQPKEYSIETDRFLVRACKKKKNHLIWDLGRIYLTISLEVRFLPLQLMGWENKLWAIVDDLILWGLVCNHEPTLIFIVLDLVYYSNS